MGTERFGRYEIIRELGRGGMAIVYLAFDPRFDRQVALKVLPRELMFREKTKARFFREAKTIAALEIPGIVPVYDYGEEDDQPFFVMGYMSGGSLAERLRDGLTEIGEFCTRGLTNRGFPDSVTINNLDYHLRLIIDKVYELCTNTQKQEINND